jgi:hypothetical protein
MDKLPEDLLIDITSFLDYKDTVYFFMTSKNNYNIYKSNEKYIFDSIFNRYKLWLINNPLSYTIRSNFKGYTIYKSVCSNHIECFKKIHNKVI